MMSNKKLKIGLLMDSLEMNSSLADLIKSLKKNKNIDIILLNNQSLSETFFKKIVRKLSDEGFLRFISIAFFSILSKFEDIVSKFDSKYAKDSANIILEKKVFNQILNIKPLFFRRYFVKYSDDDILDISNLKLDFILRGNGSGIFKGKILKVSKYGLISLHHGDNTWNRGGPPGFWEVYLKKRKSGFIIQICSEKLDDGNVIFRAETATKATYLKNRLNLSQISYPYIEKIFEYVLSNNSLPASDLTDTSKNELYKTPKFFVSLHYLIKIFSFFISKAFKRLVLGKKQVWSIGYQKGDLKKFQFDKIQRIKNPKNRFLADPFVYSKNSKTSIFVEDYSFKTNKGSISAILLDKNNNLNVKKIIEEDFHLSFPFIFEFNNQIFMVPESRRDESIRIYECIDFPFKWKFSHKIMDNIKAVDSMIFYKKPYWWLSTNICDDKSLDFSSRAHLYYSDNPLSKEWHPHLKNPVVFSSDNARNGGIILNKNKIFRTRQQYGFNQYGKELSVAEITMLEPYNFFEKTLFELKPDNYKDIEGIHHLSSNGDITVIDFVQESRQ